MKLLSGILATGVALGTLAAATQANAADIYAPGPVVGYKDVAPIAPLWTGFYIGAALGGAWTDIKNTDYDAGFQSTKGYQWYDSNSGVLGGGTLGYNWQWYNSFVFGVDLDLDGISLSNNTFNGLAGGGGALGSNWNYANNNGAFLFDATGRLGWAVGPALFYAKGGYAYVDANSNLRYTGTSSGYAYGNENGLSGWVIGGGIEYALNPSWSVKIEYLYYDFSNQRQNISYTTGTTPVTTYYPIGHEVDIDTFKVGFNYRFNNFYSPLK
jgi:outer membrane immunogenic protein